MKRLQAFKYELMPNGKQQRFMRRFAGARRFVFNKALALQKAHYEAGGKFIGYVAMAKLLTGWAYGRSQRRATRRHWLWRITGRLWMLPVAAAYVVIVFFSQYAAWEGIWSLYEQHAFLLPVPFVGL